VAGVSVTFSAPVGGHVSVASVMTDADGRASTALTLGTTAGQQLFGAAFNDLSTAIPETANPGAASSIGIVSGNGQTDTVRKTLALVVRVTDQFANPISGVGVTWARSSGGGSLGGATSTTTADGRATMTYTLGAFAGSESVTASTAGVASHAVFNFQTVAAAPATIAVVSGNAQAARVGTTLGTPLVVKVADDAGSPVSGATVSWTATNGWIAPTSSTDADGLSSAILTLGPLAGSVSATATIANGRHVTFGATAQPGIAAVATFSTQPTNGVAGAALSSVRVTLRDSYGNQVGAANPVTIKLGNNPSGGTLDGTLVRSTVNGVATFDDLKIDKAGAGYSLVASSGNVAPMTSSPFTIVDAGSTARITIQAGDDQRAAAGSPVSIAPSVRVTNAAGNPVAGASVTFSPSDGGSALPSGTLVTDASGLATLASWTLGPHAGPQTLTVSSPGLTTVVIHAGAFGGPPAMLVMATQPSAAATSGVVLDAQPAVQLQDHFGNPVAAGSLTITVTASSGSLIGTTSIAADPATGMATFTDLGIVGSGAVTLTFSAQGIQAATSTSITVSGGAAPTATQTAGGRF
jgi:adhesin/invasin